MLIGVVFAKKIDDALLAVGEMKGRVDMAEIRLDVLEEGQWPLLAHLKEKASLPLLFTFRKFSQGGQREIEEKARLALIEKALSVKPAFADIETEVDRKFIERIKALYPEVSLIGSYHDQEKTPSDLNGLFTSMKHPAFSLYKIACHAKSTIDLMRLMAFTREKSEKEAVSCISLGRWGQPCRVLGPIVGNALNYTSLETQASSLYHYDLDALQGLYGFSRLTRDTKIYALLGDPVEASPGDLFHNEIFRREGVHAVYVKLKVNALEMEEFFSLARKLPFAGFSVTMPLKEEVGRFLTRLESSASAIGAVNTVVIRGDEWIGSNTDGRGALNAIEIYGKVKGKKIALLGAGGAARAIAYEAGQRGGEVMVFHRGSSRGEKLSRDFGCKLYALDALSAHPYDLLINTIPPLPSGELPIAANFLLRGALVMDINHSSALLAIAKERGCRCLAGKAMFEEQALLQQAAFKRI